MDDDNTMQLITSDDDEQFVLDSSTSTEIDSSKFEDFDSCDEISNDSSKQCWVCLATNDEDDEKTEWIHPCRCSGTAKWVHQSCLQMWIEEKQKYNVSFNVSCTQCNTEYMIVYPSNGKIFYIIELCDNILYSVSPMATIICAFGSLYWSAFSYGAFTMMQVMGREKAQNLFYKTDPICLYFGLPSIPVCLILFKFVRWEEQLLKLWLRNQFRFPFCGYIEKCNDNFSDYSEPNLLVNYNTDSVTICRNLCGALILPTAATFFGKLLFSNVQSNLSRTILGGVTFIMTKGLIKILLRRHQFIRKSQRKILNFNKTK